MSLTFSEASFPFSSFCLYAFFFPPHFVLVVQIWFSLKKKKKSLDLFEIGSNLMFTLIISQFQHYEALSYKFCETTECAVLFQAYIKIDQTEISGTNPPPVPSCWFAVRLSKPYEYSELQLVCFFVFTLCHSLLVPLEQWPFFHLHGDADIQNHAGCTHTKDAQKHTQCLSHSQDSSWKGNLILDSFMNIHSHLLPAESF